MNQRQPHILCVKKETVHEYRYMPDPDIPAIVLDQDMLKAIREDKHIYYFAVRQQFVEFFEKFEVKIDSVPALLEGEYRDIWLAMLDDESMQTERFIRMLAFWLPEAFARIEGEKRSIDVETIKFLVGSKLEAKEVKETVIRWATSSADIQTCLPELMLDDDLKVMILETFTEFAQQVDQYKSGQEKVLQFIIGKIMAKTKGKAPATLVRERATELIKTV